MFRFLQCQRGSIARNMRTKRRHASKAKATQMKAGPTPTGWPHAAACRSSAVQKTVTASPAGADIITLCAATALPLPYLQHRFNPYQAHSAVLPCISSPLSLRLPAVLLHWRAPTQAPDTQQRASAAPLAQQPSVQPRPPAAQHAAMPPQPTGSAGTMQLLFVVFIFSTND